LKEITVKIVGAANSVDGYRLRDFLQRSGCRFEWIELGNEDSANVFMGRQLAEDQLPVCILPQGTVLYRPSLQELAHALEWFKSPKLPSMTWQFMAPVRLV
jgi:thioredoxin reductase (NADPH)